ncbi:hypothetical protein BGX26_006275, partial [Mortierella sp. AD094]
DDILVIFLQKEGLLAEDDNEAEEQPGEEDFGVEAAEAEVLEDDEQEEEYDGEDFEDKNEDNGDMAFPFLRTTTTTNNNNKQQQGRDLGHHGSRASFLTASA